MPIKPVGPMGPSGADSEDVPIGADTAVGAKMHRVHIDPKGGGEQQIILYFLGVVKKALSNRR